MFCAACSVDEGECPNCGTYWMTKWGGKRYGIRPVKENPMPSLILSDGRTVPQAWSLNALPNVVVMPWIG